LVVKVAFVAKLGFSRVGGFVWLGNTGSVERLRVL
jgi:hypothetical protein